MKDKATFLSEKAQKLSQKLLQELQTCKTGQMPPSVLDLKQALTRILTPCAVPSLRLDKLKPDFNLGSNETSQLQLKLDQTNECYQALEARYQDRLSHLDNELDEIIFFMKEQYKDHQPIGDILPGLFEESFEKAGKIEGEWEIQQQSADISGLPSRIQGEQLQLFEKLQALKRKLSQYKHTHLDQELNRSLSEVFCQSIPVSLKTISHCSSELQEEKIDNKLLTLNLSPSLERTLGFSPSENGQSVKISEVQDLLVQDLLSLDQKEKLLMTLIDNQAIQGGDVCLQDLLNISDHRSSFERLLNAVDTSRKETSKLKQTKFLKQTGPVPQSGFLKELLEECSVISDLSIIDPSKNPKSHFSVQFSEPSFLLQSHSQLSKLKSKNTSNIIPRREDSQIPSSRQQTIRSLIPKAPAQPRPSIQVPRILNFRGRSLQPLHPTNNQKRPIGFASPLSVNQIRMKRFKKLPFQPAKQMDFSKALFGPNCDSQQSHPLAQLVEKFMGTQQISGMGGMIEHQFQDIWDAHELAQTQEGPHTQAAFEAAWNEAAQGQLEDAWESQEIIRETTASILHALSMQSDPKFQQSEFFQFVKRLNSGQARIEGKQLIQDWGDIWSQQQQMDSAWDQSDPAALQQAWKENVAEEFQGA